MDIITLFFVDFFSGLGWRWCKSACFRWVFGGVLGRVLGLYIIYNVGRGPISWNGAVALGAGMDFEGVSVFDSWCQFLISIFDS